MSRRFGVLAMLPLVMLVATRAAMGVEGVIKHVDAQQRMITVVAGGQDHSIRVPEAVKILDAAGKELPDGLRSQQLQQGTRVTLGTTRQGGKMTLESIRIGGTGGALGGKRMAAGKGPAATPQPDTLGPSVKQDTSQLIPLADLGRNKYQGFEGGLYPQGKKERPATHTVTGVKLAAQVQPLSADGKPAADGKIVLLAIGFSNTVQAFNGFMSVAAEDPELNPHLVLVNGALGGMSAFKIQDPNDNGIGSRYWAHVDNQLKAAGVTRAQVQALWIKETDAAPHEGTFPGYIKTLETELTKILQHLSVTFPHAKLAYFTSRTYGGWARPKADGSAPGNSEPFSYESGFAYKWLIERQLAGDAALNFDPAKGPVKSPWLSWSAYLWTNAPQPRGDGVQFGYDDFSDRDRMHESPAGQQKVGKLLLQFFKNDPTTKPWFVQGAGSTSAAVAASATVSASTAVASSTSAGEEWEKLPDGILGRVAMFEGVGGVKIAGYVRKPAGPGPFPLVIVLHGGAATARPVSADSEAERAKLMAAEALRASQVLGRSTNPPIPEFLAQGWAVYAIDFRPNPSRQIDPPEFDDAVIAVNKAKAFPFVDPNRIAMLGGSHGGHVIGRTASRVKVNCAVLCAPAGLDPIALWHEAEKGTPIGANQGIVRSMENRSGVKMAEIEKNPEKYHYSSLMTEVPKVLCPILMISGRNDPNAPLAVMDAYVDQLRAADKEAETFHPDNGPHGFYFGFPKVIPETAEATQHAIAFIKKHFEQVNP